MNCRFIYSYLKDVLVREPLFRLRYYRLMTNESDTMHCIYGRWSYAALGECLIALKE